MYMFINTRSLKKVNATTILSVDFMENEIDICCISEIWLKEEVDDAYVDIPYFTLMRHDRTKENSSNATGGGVAAYVENSIGAEKFNPKHSYQFAVMWFASRTNPVYIYAAVYYPPLTNRSENYPKYLLRVTTLYLNLSTRTFRVRGRLQGF